MNTTAQFYYSHSRNKLAYIHRRQVCKHHLGAGHLVSKVATVRPWLEKGFYGSPFLVALQVRRVQIRLHVLRDVVQPRSGNFHIA